MEIQKNKNWDFEEVEIEDTEDTKDTKEIRMILDYYLGKKYKIQNNCYVFSFIWQYTRQSLLFTQCRCQ